MLNVLARYFKHWFGATRATGGGGNSTAGGRGVGVFAAPHATSLVDAADVFGADPEKPNSPSRITPLASAPSRATAEANKRAVYYGHQRCRRWARRVWGRRKLGHPSLTSKRLNPLIVGYILL